MSNTQGMVGGRYVSRAIDESLADPANLDELAKKIREVAGDVPEDQQVGWKAIAATVESCARTIRRLNDRLENDREVVEAAAEHAVASPGAITERLRAALLRAVKP